MYKIISISYLLLTAFVSIAQVDSTIRWVSETPYATFTEFELNPQDVLVTLPGSTYPINLGAHGKVYTSPIGVVEGTVLWGISKDSTSYCYRVVITPIYQEVEIFHTLWHINLRLGNAPSLLYLTEEPPEIVQFKVDYNKRQINKAEQLLLRLFQLKFPRLQEIYTPNVPIPYKI